MMVREFHRVIGRRRSASSRDRGRLHQVRVPCSTPTLGSRSARLLPARESVAGRFDADLAHVLFAEKRVESPMALLAAAAQAPADGQPARDLGELALRLSPITRWNSRTIIGNGWGPSTEPST